MTVKSTQTNGMSAMTTARLTRMVAMTSLARRRAPTPWKVGALTGRSRVEVMGQSFFPAITARAAALTTKVSTNSTSPAAMYAPAWMSLLNSA